LKVRNSKPLRTDATSLPEAAVVAVEVIEAPREVDVAAVAVATVPTVVTVKVETVDVVSAATDLEATELTDLEATELTDLEAIESTDPEATESIDPEATESIDPEATESIDPEAIESKELKVMRSNIKMTIAESTATATRANLVKEHILSTESPELALVNSTRRREVTEKEPGVMTRNPSMPMPMPPKKRPKNRRRSKRSLKSPLKRKKLVSPSMTTLHKSKLPPRDLSLPLNPEVTRN